MTPCFSSWLELTNTLATTSCWPATSSTKYTRSDWRDSRNTPGEIAETSSRPSSRRRSSSLIETAHGVSVSDSTAIMSTRGAAKDSTGRTHSVRLTPLENHTTISESR